MRYCPGNEDLLLQIKHSTLHLQFAMQKILRLAGILATYPRFKYSDFFTTANQHKPSHKSSSSLGVACWGSPVANNDNTNIESEQAYPILYIIHTSYTDLPYMTHHYTSVMKGESLTTPNSMVITNVIMRKTLHLSCV